MYLAETNDLIRQIKLYVEEEAWGVDISGSVNRLRLMAGLVSRLSIKKKKSISELLLNYSVLLLF
jgi:hypothetical protein